MNFRYSPVVSACALALLAGSALASSHREAPFITTSPKVDATDFYMFRSYEGVATNGSGGRSDYVTLIANYQPLQDAYGGPNYFSLDPNAQYEIHIDNNGDAREDITFQFRFKNKLNSVAIPVGTQQVAIPLIQAGTVANCQRRQPQPERNLLGERGARRPPQRPGPGHHQVQWRCGVREAGGLHRRQDPGQRRRLRGLRAAAHPQREHSRLRHAAARCSSVSARKALRSTWAPCSTWSTRRPACCSTPT